MADLGGDLAFDFEFWDFCGVALDLVVGYHEIFWFWEHEWAFDGLPARPSHLQIERYIIAHHPPIKHLSLNRNLIDHIEKHPNIGLNILMRLGLKLKLKGNPILTRQRLILDQLGLAELNKHHSLQPRLDRLQRLVTVFVDDVDGAANPNRDAIHVEFEVAVGVVEVHDVAGDELLGAVGGVVAVELYYGFVFGLLLFFHGGFSLIAVWAREAGYKG